MEGYQYGWGFLHPVAGLTYCEPNGHMGGWVYTHLAIHPFSRIPVYLKTVPFIWMQSYISSQPISKYFEPMSALVR